ncbi:hypothetical protein [Rhodoferax sp.]|uniref:hypothetical protein n=1 Tax=Rhodoferax sp. TaxID=50421 RepID=UPI0027676F68|nr:hypothetical protein [Rhodoferax sp.]
MKLLASLIAAALLAGCAGLADAGARVDVSIFDRSTGEKLDIYRHRGRLYVAGTPGNRYAVSLRNKTDARVLTVLSVDGINAISGQTAAPNQSGYVLSPWQSAEVSGWRKSMDEVAAFYFTSLDDSYAVRTLRPAHVGVIGVAVFREAEPPPPPSPAVSHEAARDQRADQASPPTAASAKGESLARQSEPRLGTGHGERMDAPTRYTDFRRASGTPAEVITVYYDSRANLIAQGVISQRPYPDRPNPFPGAPGSFAPDPKY